MIRESDYLTNPEDNKEREEKEEGIPYCSECDNTGDMITEDYANHRRIIDPCICGRSFRSRRYEYAEDHKPTEIQERTLLSIETINC